ncbi:MAG: glycosyltransferase family 39 protein [Candidatus Altiarchaeota archaeon]|nr:glycosyltransferase family 39 protein [Candidatus Altiarchaeota archaeon]
MDSKISAVIIFGILLRILFWTTAPVTGDATFHLTITAYIAEHKTVPVFEDAAGPNPFWYPPLFHLSSAIIYYITGVDRLAPLLFGILGIFAFYKFTKNHFPKYNTFSTAILALMPFHIYYSSIAYPETLMFLVATLAYNSYFNWMKNKRTGEFFNAVGFSSLALMTHYYGFIVLCSVAAHLAIKNKKNAILFFTIGVILSSPWYLRNYAIFGNPLWPKLGAGYYKGDSAIQALPLADAVYNVLNPKRWAGTYFDFLMGAPNSGEDLLEKTAANAGNKAILWLGAVMWFVAALVFLHFLFKGLNCLSIKDAILPALAFVISILPYSGNNLARMFVCAIPFIPVIIAKGIGSRQSLTFFAAIIVLTAGSYTYAYTNMKVREEYTPFFNLMKERIGSDERVLMPYKVGECLYFSKKRCARVGSAGGVQIVDEEELEENIAENRISYVCCTSMNYDSLRGYNRMVCEHYSRGQPSFSYVKNNIWGKCWVV